MRGDWSSDMCSSDLEQLPAEVAKAVERLDLNQISAPFIMKNQKNGRSEERRVGKECDSTCSSNWSGVPFNKKLVNSI